MGARIKPDEREAILKEKLGSNYEGVMKTATKLGDKVTAFVKDYNQDIIKSQISMLVEQKKAKLNIIDSDDIDRGPSTSKGTRDTHRHEKNKRNKKSNPSLVEQSDVEMYEQWKKENIKSRIPDVSIPKLLLMLEKIERESRLEETQKELIQCRKQLAHPYESTCDHTQNELRALRSCLLTRNWDDMILILFKLVSRDNSHVFIPTVKMMCEIMVEYNPMVKELHLVQQFQELFKHVATIYKGLD